MGKCPFPSWWYGFLWEEEDIFIKRRKRSTDFISQGIALILALLVMVVLFLVVLEYRWRSLLELKRGANLKRILQCQHVASMGVAHAISLLRKDPKNYGPGNAWYSFRPGAPKRIFYVDETKRSWYTFTCEDEDGKLNLNNPKLDKELVRLFQLFGYTSTRASLFKDSLLDWIDPDKEHRINGKEDDYYQRLRPRYHCKDAPLDSLQELFLLHGFRTENPRRFFGRNPRKMDLRKIASTFRGKDKRININTASDPILSAVLGLSSIHIQALKARRRALKPLKNSQDLRKMGIKRRRGIKYTSHVFRIKVRAWIKDFSLPRQVEVVVYIGKRREVTLLSYSAK